MQRPIFTNRTPRHAEKKGCIWCVSNSNGNRTAADGSTYGTPASDDEITTNDNVTYGYDKDGNLTSQIDPTTGTTISYEYDSRDRLVETSDSTADC